MPHSRAGRAVAAALLAIPLAGCFGTTAKVTTTVRCPAALVSLPKAAPDKRPVKPTAGEDFTTLMKFREAADTYIGALLRQASAREAQVRECPSGEDGG